MTAARDPITTNRKHIEHRPSTELLKGAVSWKCERCSHEGYFFAHDFVPVDYHTWREIA